MTDIPQSTLISLKGSLPRLKELDRKKRLHQLSTQERSEWARLYAQTLILFEPRQQQRIEQRSAVRIPCRIRVDYQLGHENHHTMSHDLGFLGVGIEFKQPLATETGCSLTLHLTYRTIWGSLKSQPHQIQGLIRSRNPKTNRIGLAFRSITTKIHRSIERTIYQSIEEEINHRLTSPPHGNSNATTGTQENLDGIAQEERISADQGINGMLWFAKVFFEISDC